MVTNLMGRLVRARQRHHNRTGKGTKDLAAIRAHHLLVSTPIDWLTWITTKSLHRHRPLAPLLTRAGVICPTAGSPRVLLRQMTDNGVAGDN